MPRNHPAGRARERALAVLLAVLLTTGAAGCGNDDDGARPAPRRQGADRSPAPVPASPDPDPSSRPAPAPAAVAWTRAEVLRRVDGRMIRVAGRRVRVDGATVACGGLGAPADVRGGEQAWTRFRCVQPTFPAGAVVGPDAVFVVRPTGRRSFEVTGQRFTDY